MNTQRKPTAILEATGAYKKNPDRRHLDEPIVTKAIGKPPMDLEPDEKKAWNELVDQAPDGVLTYADRYNLEMASALIAEFRSDRRAFPATRINSLIKILASFGMSPADRSRVSVANKVDKESEFGL